MVYRVLGFNVRGGGGGFDIRGRGLVGPSVALIWVVLVGGFPKLAVPFRGSILRKTSHISWGGYIIAGHLLGNTLKPKTLNPKPYPKRFTAPRWKPPSLGLSS